MEFHGIAGILETVGQHPDCRHGNAAVFLTEVAEQRSVNTAQLFFIYDDGAVVNDTGGEQRIRDCELQYETPTHTPTDRTDSIGQYCLQGPEIVRGGEQILGQMRTKRVTQMESILVIPRSPPVEINLQRHVTCGGELSRNLRIEFLKAVYTVDFDHRWE